MSINLSIIGTILAIIGYNLKIMKEDKFYLIIAFYTLMEILQAFQYSYVNQCESPINIILTNFAYILVIVQPLMWNIYFYNKITSQKDKGIFILAIALCLIWILLNIYLRLTYTPKFNEYNKCGLFNNTKTCTLKDTPTSHLYWKWTTAHYHDFTANLFMYLCIWFIPALLVSDTRFTSIYLILGAIAGFLLTRTYGNSDFEIPSIWCFISIPIITLTFLKSVVINK
jgi:hypothetical protein